MKKMRIGPFDYTVIRKENFSIDGISYYGYVDHINNIITVRKGLSKQRVTEVLWHEALHAMCEQNGIELDEVEVLRLSKSICQVIRDNRKLAER
jgi:hypothetical protein